METKKKTSFFKKLLEILRCKRVFFPLLLKSNEKLEAMEPRQQTRSPQSWLGIRGGGAPPGRLWKHSDYSLPTRNNRHRINRPPINQLLIRTIGAARLGLPTPTPTPPAVLRRRVRKTRPVSSAQELREPPPRPSDPVSRRQKRPDVGCAAASCLEAAPGFWPSSGFCLEPWADCWSVQA